jgi:hypothetical protein
MRGSCRGCGTILRGAGGAGATNLCPCPVGLGFPRLGRACPGAPRRTAPWLGAGGALGGVVGALAATTGGACGTAGRGGATGAAVAAGGFCATGVWATGACAGGTVTGGRCGGRCAAAAASSLRCWIALRTSPGFETRDQSIFCFGSLLSCLDDAEPFRPPRWKYPRTRSASFSSSELEWVFFSVTPTAVKASRISLLFTSSSRAKSLIRTLLIRPFVSSPPFRQTFISALTAVVLTRNSIIL